MASQLSGEDLARHYIASPTSGHGTLSQLNHRLNIIQNFWAIPAGAKVLEIGAGQGDCTLALAAAVGDAGHVTALDPCDPDYGSPWTVGQAQAHLKNGELGHRITFHLQTNAPDFLKETDEVFDYAVLFNCIWYFDSPKRIMDLLALLVAEKKVKKILIAEWALEARSLNQVPHVLAALARESLEYMNPTSSQNIRTAVSPAWFRRSFEKLGVKIEKEEMFLPPKDQRDATWEVKSVLGPKFADEVRRFAKGEQEETSLLLMQDAIKSSLQVVGDDANAVECMMVWAAVV